MTKSSLIFKATLALLLFFCLIVIYIPQSIYFVQRDDFADYFINLIMPTLPYGLLFVGAFVLTLSIVPKILLKYVVAVLLVFAVVFWINVDFFAISYGVLDGSEIDFDHFKQRGVLELIIYGVALLVSLVFHRFILKHLPFLVVLLLIGQLAMTAVNVIQEPADKEMVEDVDEEFFKYSADKNIILIVLDTFGSTYFQQIISKNPTIGKNYPGFVSYTDAISNYSATKGSVPSFLMGEMIPENIKYKRYLHEQVSSEGLLKHMSNNGYLVSMVSVYSWFKEIFAERYIYQPQVNQQDLTEFYGSQLIDFSLFRVTPHVFKHKVYNGGHWLLSRKVAVKTEVPNTFPERGKALMNMMTQNAVIDQEDNTHRFKMIHVTLPHPQYVYDQDCKSDHSNRGLPVTFLMYWQSSCALKVLDELLDKYKALGIYDKSLIVVTSDHGSRVLSDKSLTGFPSYFEMNTSGIMFMIKGINQNTPFWQIDTPFSLIKLKDALQNEDLHETAYDFLRDDNRMFYAYRNNHKSGKGFMQDAPLYKVDKDFSQASSWHLERLVVNKCETEELPLTLSLSQFDRDGYCSLYGFDDSGGNATGAWTQSVDNRVVLKISDEFKHIGDVRTLTLTFKSRILETQPELQFIALVNGQVIGDALISSPDKQELTFEFDAGLLQKQKVDTLQLNLPLVKSNIEMGINMNQRKLGLLIESIAIQ